MGAEQQAALARLDDLLERERGALLAGRLERLPALLEEKTALLAALAGAGDAAAPGPERQHLLTALGAKAARNQTLLEAALRGIRAATGRIAALRQTRRTFETYDRAGRRRPIGDDAAARLERRA
ncbi:MAG: hypothetical protein Kow0058_13040 [Roseovarius sp.]